ncbi:unnamed protein product [Rhizophagus irregularis]|uniref:Uncharacterized protein n=1 Tax=Rhizophagus irregularis TaxID=588596 RepID=A0A2I1G971_9GLOM|nr:hypothetical protein RhiirA4_457135 [Rhizophagus irregularis]CAB4421410.1 unnamed protein product [Rhizophagus irregularis]
MSYNNSMMGGSQKLHPPDSTINDNNLSTPPSFNHCFDISPNQFDREQFNLFSLLLSYQLHGLILTETNLQSPSHKYVCEPYLSQYNYHKWKAFPEGTLS